MKKSTQVELNIRFRDSEADDVIKFKEANPAVRHKDIYLAGIKALKK